MNFPLCPVTIDTASISTYYSNGLLLGMFSAPVRADCGSANKN